MEATDRRAHWDKVYAGKAEAELSWYQPVPRASLELIARANPAKDARIIDVGGGESRLVDALLDRGFTDITVLDVSPTALDRAAARLGQRAGLVKWIAADITAWSPPERYDLWHDRAVFHFLVDPRDRAAYVAAMGAGVARGGQVIVGTFAVDGPDRCSGLPVARYDGAGLAKSLGSGFRLVEERREAHVTPAGRVQSFQFSRLARD